MNLKGRNFLKLMDFTPEEITYMIDLAADLKAKKKQGIPHDSLTGKNIALIFEKTSTRTRCSFEVAAHDLGMHVTYLDPSGSQIGKKESIPDTARVLGRMFDGIEYRGYGQDIVEELAKYAGVPVWNGLTNEFHPTQMLADMLTIREHLGRLKGVRLVYMGDARYNMGNSLMVTCAKLGMDFVACTSKKYFPDAKLVEYCEGVAKETGASITLTEDVKEGTKDADVIYTDVWVSMGEPDEIWEERLHDLMPYQVNKEAMANAKEIKERMASIEETRKITNAMYLISSSKMKQAKKKLADTEPFFYAMQAEIARILRHVPDMHSQFFDGRESIPDEERKIGYIVVTADKGLAGAYNHNVIKATEELLKKPGKHKLFVLGEAGRQYFAKREGIEMDTQFRYTVQNPTLHRSRVISSEMVEQFRNGDLDEIHIIYTRMINAMTAETEEQKLLPMKKTTFLPEDMPALVGTGLYQEDMVFWPSTHSVMANIVPNYINGIVYGCLVEAYCSEHNARMQAMQNATDSATDMLNELNITYNRVRQADITQELTEIIGGANAQKRK